MVALLVMIIEFYCTNTREYTNIPSCREKLVFDSSRLQEGIFISISFFLSILVSLILEHYTRECEFGNFDEIKNKNNTKNKTTQKNVWLNFCLNKEYPKLLCGLGICHRRRQTFFDVEQFGGKGNSSGHH